MKRNDPQLANILRKKVVRLETILSRFLLMAQSVTMKEKPSICSTKFPNVVAEVMYSSIME